METFLSPLGLLSTGMIFNNCCTLVRCLETMLSRSRQTRRNINRRENKTKQEEEEEEEEEEEM